MAMPELHMLVRKDVGFWGDSLSLFMYTKDIMQPSKIGIAQPLVFDWQDEGGIVPSQASVGGMKIETAVRLMDSLWEAGVRPSRQDITSQDAEIRAMRAHIEDLRKLLWNRIGMEATP
jgi:hypothetical protein